MNIYDLRPQGGENAGAAIKLPETRISNFLDRIRPWQTGVGMPGDGQMVAAENRPHYFGIDVNGIGAFDGQIHKIKTRFAKGYDLIVNRLGRVIHDTNLQLGFLQKGFDIECRSKGSARHQAIKITV